MSFNAYSAEALESIARKVISGYNSALLYKPGPIPVEEIMEKVYGLTLEYQYIRNNGRILGETIFEDADIPVYDKEGKGGYKLISVKAGTVVLDVSLLEEGCSGRLRFTCAHELAHWVIDKKYFTGQSSKTNTPLGVTDTGVSSGLTDFEIAVHQSRQANIITRSSDTDTLVERQANKLAASILMPKSSLKRAYYDTRDKKANIESYLAALYEVSVQAMTIRLDCLGLPYK